ncbi:hypothetical protein HW555_006901 [Spodoptera exigua]|uniref:L-serine deaminase n=1 Tax=Spodoptera exigua TaxID=7107 RepID=A0A835L9I7_SPOEX|nr:hypothetical protein HW555_006901 [Spodoptera exigua]
MLDLEYDPNCDPDNPRKIKYEDILAAYQRMVGQVIRTQCPRAHMSKKLGVELYMKQDFKERGIYNALVLLSDEQKKLGVITSSSGNSGIAMALNCSKLGIPCSVVMPFKASIFKRTLAERLGAKIILHGKDMADSKRHAMMLARERKLTFDHPHIIEGDGTIGIEIIDQLPDVDAVLVPCGGGSLLTGVAIAVKHLKPDTEVYGVETDKSCSMMEALKKNERVFVPIDSTIADALAVNKVGVNTFFSLKGMVDKMVVVKEDWVARAIMHIVEEEKFAVEGGGAVGVAALMAGLFPNLRGKKVVTICTGGNMDTTTLGRALERGMAAEGRLLKFKVSVSDRPTGIADLCTMLAGIGASVRDCVPERACVKGDWKVIVETRGWDHTKELVDLIKKNFKEYLFAESTENPERTVSVKRGPCLAPNPYPPSIDFDPYCDPHNPKAVLFSHVVQADKMIKSNIDASPLLKSKCCDKFGMDLYFKVETGSKTGSFHERSALYALLMLTPEERKEGVYTASVGNWAMALAYQGQLLEVHVTVVLPEHTQLSIISHCEEYGATIVLHGKNIDEAREHAFKLMHDEERHGVYINGYDHPNVIAAAGSIGVEILDQLPETEAILVPVGGGGLIAGIAAFVKHANPNILIYGIEPGRSCSFSKAMHNERPYKIDDDIGLASSLNIHKVGYNAFHTARSLIDKMLVITPRNIDLPSKVFKIFKTMDCNILHSEFNGNHDWLEEGKLMQHSLTIICETKGYKHACLLRHVLEKLFPGQCEFHREVFKPIVYCSCFPKRIY